jgi:peroxiredoxin
MMQAIKFLPKGPEKLKRRGATPVGLPGLPAPAPDWDLKAIDGQAVQCKSFRGKHLLVVFNRGLNCLHCSDQLTALAKYEARFGELGVGIAAISPQWPDAAATRSAAKQLGISFPLLADPTLRTFRSYGCCDDEEPMHGVFIIDRSGLVRWQFVSADAETDPERLLSVVRSHLVLAPGHPK